MGQYDRSVKELVIRIRESYNLINSIVEQLKGNCSPGKRQSLLKQQIHHESRLKSLAKRLDDMVKGNIVTLTFRDTNTSNKYRIVYTNISAEDAEYHLKLMMQMKGITIEVLEIKEVKTQNAWTKL